MAAGRPSIYNEPEDLAAAIDRYFNSLDNTPANATILGMVVYLGFADRSSLRDYSKRNDEFSYIIKKAISTIGAIHEARTYENGCAGSIWWLTNHGWENPMFDNVAKTEVVETKVVLPDGMDLSNEILKMVNKAVDDRENSDV